MLQRPVMPLQRSLSNRLSGHSKSPVESKTDEIRVRSRPSGFRVSIPLLMLFLLAILTHQARAQSAVSVTPGPQEAAELLQRIALNLDLCPLGRAGSTFSFPSTPPSCRSRYLYWIYDDPSTPLFAPDKLYLYGGLQTSSVQDLATPSSYVPILADMWELSWAPNEGNPSSGANWTLSWSCLSGCGAPSGITGSPGPRADAATWFLADGLYFFGGFGPGSASNSTQSGYLNDIWCFNLTTTTWYYISGDLTPDIAVDSQSTPVSLVSYFSRDSDATSRREHHIPSHRSSEPSVTMLYAPSTPVSPGTVIANGLPKVAGAFAGVTSLIAPELTNGNAIYGIWINGGQNNSGYSVNTYNISLAHLERPSSQNLPILSPGIISQYGRSGGLFYPSLGTLSDAAVYMYGGQVAGFPQYDRDIFLLSDPTADLSLYFPCLSDYCAQNPDVYGCHWCLYSLPTRDYTGGLRYAGLTDVYVNKTFHYNNYTWTELIRYETVLGGQNYNETTLNGQNYEIWVSNPTFETVYPPFETLAEVELLDVHRCPQVSPVYASATPWLFQCVNMVWSAASYNMLPSTAKLSLSSGAPALMMGNWTNVDLHLGLQLGSSLNVTGVLSNASVAVMFCVNATEWNNTAIDLISEIAVLETADLSNVVFGPNVTFTLRSASSAASPISSLTLNCSIHTITAAYLQASPTTYGRTVVSAILQWQTQSTNNPACPPPPLPPPPPSGSSPVVGIVLGIFIPLSAFCILALVVIARNRPFKRGFGGEESAPASDETLVDMPAFSAADEALNDMNSTTELSTSTPNLSGPTQDHEDADQDASSNDEVEVDSIPVTPIGATPRSGISRSDLDYESGLGSLDTSFDMEHAQDQAYMPNLSQV